VQESDPRPSPGWYRDPYHPGSIRWFDGSVWTTHAAPDNTSRPDALVEAHHDKRSPEELRQQERFSKWDVAVVRRGEPAFNGGGGRAALDANRMIRLADRAGLNGPVNLARWLLGATIIVAVLAWADHRHRLMLSVVAAVLLVAAVVVEIRAIRERAYWRDAGRSG
jgi:hypothetical protein